MRYRAACSPAVGLEHQEQRHGKREDDEDRGVGLCRRRRASRHRKVVVHRNGQGKQLHEQQLPHESQGHAQAVGQWVDQVKLLGRVGQ